MRVIIGALIIVGLCAPAAFADTSAADKLFVEGRDLLKNKQFKAACEKFHAANAIDPAAPGVMLNLGLCYEGLGKKATSLLWFRKAQTAASEATPRATDYENAAAEKKAALAAQVATLKIDTNGIPPEVEILVDGVRQDRDQLASPVELDQGTHKIEARAPGKTSFTQDIAIKDGQKIGIDKDTRPITIPALADAPKIKPVATARGHGTLGWVLASVGVAAVVAIPFEANCVVQGS